MSQPARASSPRRDTLLEAAYCYVLEHGLSDLSLRPLAAAIGSSPRVLLFLFGSKDGMVRALLARARADELAVLDRLRQQHRRDSTSLVRATWDWLVAERHRPLLTLWLEAYARSLTEPDGPWADFARNTVDDWLELLALAETPADRRPRDRLAGRTLALAVLRGALLDLLATGDVRRASDAIDRYLAAFPDG